MVKEMAELKGKMVLGASWELPCYFGRGQTRKEILAIKNDPTTSHINFARNYGSEWVGLVDGALVSIGKLMNLRVEKIARPRPRKNKEYYLSIDVARSFKESNNKSAFTVGEVERHEKSGAIKSVTIVYIYVPPNGLSFEEQAYIARRMDKIYNFETVIVDINGLGMPVFEELLKNSVDPKTGENYPAWTSINTEHTSHNPTGVRKLYGIKSHVDHALERSIQAFIDYVDTEKLRLLIPSAELKIPENFTQSQKAEVRACHFRTDQLIDQVANLRLSKDSKRVERVSKKTDMDIYDTIAYLLFYLNKHENVTNRMEQEDASSFFFMD